ncbi:MAG: fumarylacetoacetate hydrolase family protein [Actinomycetota bacterium]|nr:fumarylacetoacetate hydrolase family protein [Actinomycetota bacterium]
MLKNGVIETLEPSQNSEVDFPVYHTSDVKLLAPVLPTKIVAVGLNYTDHAEELGMDIPEEPLLFLKGLNTVIGPGDEIVYPLQSKKVEYEAELAVVIGKEAKDVSEDEAESFILGYTCSMDITARDLQKKDGQWTRAKNFDTFCPLGPWVETELDSRDLLISLRLNGRTMQCQRTSKMIFKVKTLVSFISEVMTLFPGDVILTGTPCGVGELKPGDMVEVDVEGIGNLACPVKKKDR